MAISNYIPSSRIAQSGVCTSSTRPASPYEGQMIYETDTDKVLVWNGSAWYPNWNLPWGVVGFASTGSSQSVTSTTDMTGVSVVFNAVSGRRYKTTLSLELYNTQAATRAFVAINNGSSDLRGWSLYMQTGGDQTPFTLLYSETSLSGSTTRKVRFGQGFGNTGSVSTFGLQQMYVEDIGPA